MHVLIIGNGIAGITAARHIRKRDSAARITVVSGESKFFFSRTALMYVYMGHMKFEHTKPYEDWFWEKNRITLKQQWVKSIDIDANRILCSDESSIPYDKLILALGSKPRMLSWKGIDAQGVQALYSKQDLEAIERNTVNATHAAIVGGGLIGIEMAEMLRSRDIEVTMIIREDRIWGNVLPESEASLIKDHLEAHGVHFIFNAELEEIHRDSNNRVKGVSLKNGQEISCDFLGICIGVQPNIEFLKDSGLDLNQGVLVDEYLQSSRPGVYAIGDCAELKDPPDGRSAVEQMWYTGRMMGECVAVTLCGERTVYKPGPFFNSAKFFDLEFQTYGNVSSERSTSDFVWISEDQRSLIRISYDHNSEIVYGVNAIGFRLRHELLDKWLLEGIALDQFVEELSSLDFNPEFNKKRVRIIKESYSKQTGRQLKKTPKNWRRILSGKL